MNPNRCHECGRARPTWTPAAIITAIQTWAETHDGQGPSRRDWIKAAPHHPSFQTVWEVFGGLKAACAAAGVEKAPRKNAAGVGWTRELIVAAVYRWRFENGRLPISRDWNIPPEGFPSQSTVRRHFGSWNAAIVAAGYEPNHAFRSVSGYQHQAGAATRNRVAA